MIALLSAVRSVEIQARGAKSPVVRASNAAAHSAARRSGNVLLAAIEFGWLPEAPAAGMVRLSCIVLTGKDRVRCGEYPPCERSFSPSLLPSPVARQLLTGFRPTSLKISLPS